jgi:lysophospholipase
MLQRRDIAPRNARHRRVTHRSQDAESSSPASPPMSASSNGIAHLPRRFHEPPGLRWSEYSGSGAARLRWCALAVADPVAHCVIVGGFSECAEKYFETIADFAARRTTVWFLDWRGQGASTRDHPRPARPRARCFDEDAADLAGFTAEVIGHARPRVIVGHSMGAAIALLALRAQPALFDAAILSAPMLGLRMSRVPRTMAHAVVAAAVALRLGHALVPGMRVWPADPWRSPAQSRTSSDEHRCRVQPSWFAERPHLRVDGVTYAWLGAALALCRRFEDPQLLAGVGTPVLIGSAGRDAFVDVAAHRRAASLLRACRHVELADARHDLFMEADRIRDRWLAEIDAFLQGALHSD